MAPRGRPRSFDRDAALRSAMNVFWRRGYDGASLDELLRAMGGITPPSFYAAFGSKEDLFLEVIELYQRTASTEPLEALNNTSPVRDAVHAMLRATVDAFDNAPGGRGCLLVLAAPTLTRTNASVHERLRGIRCQLPEMLEKRLKRGIAEGELPARLRVDDIAAFYTTVIHGLAVRARDGETRRAMLAVADGAMAAWDGLVSRGTRRRVAARARPRPTARRR